MSEAIRIKLADFYEADRFVKWTLTRDDFPYVFMTDGFTEYVIIVPISEVMVDE